jgi:hypothetical protein
MVLRYLGRLDPIRVGLLRLWYHHHDDSIRVSLLRLWYHHHEGPIRVGLLRRIEANVPAA